MNKLLIKICGVHHPEIAREASLAGANFIGIVFHPLSKRYVANINTAKLIADEAKAFGAMPVAVFTNHTAEVMRRICEATNIEIVQLQGTISKSQHHLLPKHYQRIYVQSITNNGEVYNDDPNALSYCKKERDFLLFDNINAGSGKLINWKQFEFQNADNFRWFLAGGLTPDNVLKIIYKLHPTGVDVSTGVENKTGEKDILLIRKFISRVNENSQRKVT